MGRPFGILNFKAGTSFVVYVSLYELPFVESVPRVCVFFSSFFFSSCFQAHLIIRYLRGCYSNTILLAINYNTRIRSRKQRFIACASPCEICITYSIRHNRESVSSYISFLRPSNFAPKRLTSNFISLNFLLKHSEVLSNEKISLIKSGSKILWILSK